MTTKHHPSPQSGVQIPTVLPAMRPYTSAFPEKERDEIAGRVVSCLLSHASGSWYSIAKTIAWGMVQFYEEQTDTLTLGVYRRLIQQVENFLWSLPDPYQDDDDDVEWDSEACGEWADRIINGVLQTIRPDFFATQEQEVNE